MTVTFDVAEIIELQRSLAIVHRRAPERAARLVARAGDRTVADAVAICPVDTGLLRSTIGRDNDADRLGWTAGPTVDYAPFVEYGTVKMAAQPYMGPAFNRAVPTAIAEAEDLAGSLW